MGKRIEDKFALPELSPQMRYYLRRKESKMCVVCNRVMVAGGVRCTTCNLKRNAKRRKPESEVACTLS